MGREEMTSHGICRGTHRVLITPVFDVVAVGGSNDVIYDTFKAVHHYNRNAQRDDYVAVAFPMMNKFSGVFSAGDEIELIGSKEAISVVLSDTRIQTFIRRNMLKNIDVLEITVEPGDIGSAYLRDQSAHKRTVGWLRRRAARAERRQAEGRAKNPPNPKKRPLQYDSSDFLRIPLDKMPILISEHISTYNGDVIKVNTFGLSSPGRIAVLPVVPHYSKRTSDE